MGDDIIHDSEDLFDGFGAEEGYTCLLEVCESFEDRRRGKMATGMHDTFAFVVATPRDGSEDVFFEDGDFVRHRPRRSR